MRIKQISSLLSFHFFFIIYAVTLNPGYAQDQQHPSIHQTEHEKYRNDYFVQDRVDILTGLENLIQNYRNKIVGKKLGIVTNHTGVDSHGIPIWIRLNEIPDVEVTALYSPEHGLLGKFQAGEKVSEQKHPLNSLKVFSLYGKTKKPTPEMLKNIDILIYDIQDIGVRFYTYISTMGLVLEAAGENNIPVLILDRPNPITCTRVFGPVLDLNFKSFVGYYPIPIQYGLTVGELANMVIGEEWILSKPAMEVIPLVNWTRNMWYDQTTLPWIQTSPNIPDLATATVYPGTCFLEATNVSEGRGTSYPFIRIGAPWIDGKQLAMSMNMHNLPGVVFSPTEFTPSFPAGSGGHTKYQNEKCYGIEIKVIERNSLNSVKMGVYLITTLKTLYPAKLEVNEVSLNRLFGTDILMKGLNSGLKPEEIIQQFEQGVDNFKQLRKNYLIY